MVTNVRILSPPPNGHQVDGAASCDEFTGVCDIEITHSNEAHVSGSGLLLSARNPIRRLSSVSYYDTVVEKSMRARATYRSKSLP